jgi:hypothetical protein
MSAAQAETGVKVRTPISSVPLFPGGDQTRNKGNKINQGSKKRIGKISNI